MKGYEQSLLYVEHSTIIELYSIGRRADCGDDPGRD